MAQEKGGEQPLNKFARFKEDISLWYAEMDSYGLTKEEQKLLEPILKISYGICEAQEKIMLLVQIPECGGFDLTWADRLRKAVGKKNPADYEQLTKEYFNRIEEKNLSKPLANYVWNVLIATSRGYGFNNSHTLAYSLIALQEMNLAYKFPTIFWDCACLISDSGGFVDRNSEEVETIVEEEEDKKKTRTTDYGKIASAIGRIQEKGVKVIPPSINKSTMNFTPDVENNVIRYGLSGVTRINEDIIHSTINNRPYTSLKDFLSKVKVNKPQAVNLIKSGAFDEFDHREDIMHDYIYSIADTKKTINLRNFQMLINFGLIPEEFSFEVKCFNYNKYVKKFKTTYDGSEYYVLDKQGFRFWEENFDVDVLVPCETSESGFIVPVGQWDKKYKATQNVTRPWVKKNHDELRSAVNDRLFMDMWNKYCEGDTRKWEMDSMSYYPEGHELDNVDAEKNGFEQFVNLPEQPDVDKIITIKGKTVPLFKISRIYGTVLDRNKDKKLVTLLTTTGVVTVRLFGDLFTHYDRQISEKRADGTKKIIEPSIFSRGNKIVISGIRREDVFVAKKYGRTPWHTVELIEKVQEDGIAVTRARYGQEG